MIDHVMLHVKDYDQSKGFYRIALKPLGYEVVDGNNVEAVCHNPEQE